MNLSRSVIAIFIILAIAGVIFVVFERPQYLEDTPFYGYAKIVREKTFSFVESAKSLASEIVSSHPNIQKTVDNVKEQTTKITESPSQIFEPIESVQKAVESTNQIISSNHDELIEYALEKINEDRVKNNLTPVLLSSNQAAQIHANDVFDNKMISHWMSNGEKPYMTYTKEGGKGYVSQNVAVSSCSGFGCVVNPKKEIENAQYSMMYDDASSNWGHRDNILEPYHTHVSIGIAYNDNFFVLVQNFEDNYLISDNSITVAGSNVHIQGNLKSGKILNVGIFYDPPPTPDLYMLHREDGYYEMGDTVAVVAPPPPPGSYYTQPVDYKLIEAKSWSTGENHVLIDFDLSPVLDRSGVYTIGVWINDGGQEFVVTDHSLFYK